MPIRFFICALAAFAIATATDAGDLDPPAGPIGATDTIKLNSQTTTLPLTISEPGSYIFTSHLTGVAGEDGIIIASNDVTINLNGFTLRGVPGSLDGISPDLSQGDLDLQNINIHNGHIVGWGRRGIITGELKNNNGEFTFSEILGARIHDLSVTDCGSQGIAAQDDAVIERCTVRNCGGGGIWATGAGAVIISCTVSNCGSVGVLVQQSGLIEKCVSRENASNGFTLTNAVAIDCVAESNDSDGFRFQGPQSSATNCKARGNLENGFELTRDSRLTGCSSFDNIMSGVVVLSGGGLDQRVLITDCLITGNGRFGIDFGSSQGSNAYRNVIRDNDDGAINGAANNDAPTSATGAGAGPFDNIVP